MVVGIVAVVVVTRGDDGDVELTHAELEAALMSEEEVGEGYVESEPRPDDEPPLFRGASSEDDSCHELLARLEAQDDPFVTTSGIGSETVKRKYELDGEDRVQHAVGNGVGDRIDTWNEVLDACRELELRGSDGQAVIERARPIEVGDESVVVKVTTADHEWLYAAWARQGVGAAVVLYGVKARDRPAPPDQVELARLVRLADSKLQNAISSG
jgi:hypothetical protein